MLKRMLGIFFVCCFVLWVSVGAGLPNITGCAAGTRRMDNAQSDANSALYWMWLNWVDAMAFYSATAAADIGFDASRSSSVYQNNAPVRPLSMTTTFLIRY